jgi:hypothetical protein
MESSSCSTGELDFHAIVSSMEAKVVGLTCSKLRRSSYFGMLLPKLALAVHSAACTIFVSIWALAVERVSVDAYLSPPIVPVVSACHNL